MIDKLGLLPTEQRNPRTTELDVVSTERMAALIHAENQAAGEAVRSILPAIAGVIDEAARRAAQGGRVIQLGAGTSGRLAVLDASEIPPTFGASPDLFVGLIAGGDEALRNSIEGAEDSEEAGAADISGLGIGANDVVIGVAASGRTPYGVGALQAARNAGAYTVALVNAPGSPMAKAADIELCANTGPEALTGSTRLKAGTAQKMVLNLISTGVMVRLGKVYSNLMVDVSATNTKLRERVIRIIRELTALDANEARELAERCDWHAKTAVVSCARNVSPAEARSLLDQAGGNLRSVLEA